MIRTSVDMCVSSEGAISSLMVAALEQAWSAIQVRHPELPDMVMVLDAGSSHGPSLTSGHFAAMRWRAPEPVAAEDDTVDSEGDAQGHPAGVQRWAEVFVGGQGLAPSDALATLLHEAAHALAHVRGIKDTSRQGRWHNARFKTLAEEVGIAVAKDVRLGGSPTTLRPETRAFYSQVIEELGRCTAAAPGCGDRWRRRIEAGPAALCLRVRPQDPHPQVRPSRRADPMRRVR